MVARNSSTLGRMRAISLGIRLCLLCPTMGCGSGKVGEIHVHAGGTGASAGAGIGGASSGGTSFTESAQANPGGAAMGTGTTMVASTVLLHADFQTRNAGPYTQAMVDADFSGIPSWNNGLDAGRATIVDEAGEKFLRVAYVGAAFGPTDNGVQFLVPLSGTFEELYLSYRVRFASGFEFVKGGKLPGLVGGTHPTGCISDTGGFSARMMWRTSGAAVQYMYFPEKVNSCGDDFAYAANGTDLVFAPGQWHRVMHRIRMNQAGSHDGILQAWLDDQLALDNQSFIYRIVGATFGVDALYFSTFFGGSDSTWAPATAQVADFDDFIVSTARP